MSEMTDPVQAQLIASRRTQILDAAARIFAEQGFHGATVRDVARAAGVADGTIYNYFTNKTDLLIGLLDRLNATEERPLDFAAGQAGPFTAFVPAYLEKRMATLWANRDLLRAVLPIVLSDPAVRERYFTQIIAPTLAIGETYMQAAGASGRIRALDARLVTRLLAGMSLGVVMLDLLGDTYLDAHTDEMTAVMAALIVAGLDPQTGDPNEQHRRAEPGESAI
jgi:TetR/AcrR family fatty acid metabolism transcriptional regulator